MDINFFNAQLIITKAGLLVNIFYPKIIIHEMGHFLIGKVVGMNPQTIFIDHLNGHVTFPKNKITTKKHIAVLIAGYLTECLVAHIIFQFLPMINNNKLCHIYINAYCSISTISNLIEILKILIWNKNKNHDFSKILSYKYYKLITASTLFIGLSGFFFTYNLSKITNSIINTYLNI